MSTPAIAPAATRSRHALTVRVTHWITAICFLCLLLSGIEILISHPRFYWGETGNDLTTPLFQFPIPSSRQHVPTGYTYTLPDQNGWSRALHFQSAWALLLAGAVYLLFSLATGHLRHDLIPAPAQRTWHHLRHTLASHLRLQRPSPAEAYSYNVLQRLAYLAVLFLLIPGILWTGLAMSPAFVSAFPATVTLLGGRQTARTLHLFLTIALILFFAVHLFMVWRAGFWKRVRAMILSERP